MFFINAALLYILFSALFTALSTAAPLRVRLGLAAGLSGRDVTQATMSKPRDGNGGWPTSTDWNAEKPKIGYTSGSLYADSSIKEVQGKIALVAQYPKGHYAEHGPNGFIFDATGNSDLKGKKKVKLSYSVYFPEDFKPAKGGKLPGLFGGDASGGCAGGKHSDTCWSARLMWRTPADSNSKEIEGEIYAYIPSTNDVSKINCDQSKGECNAKYGFSIGRGKIKFTLGQWNSVEETVTIDDKGQKNGRFDVTVNGDQDNQGDLDLKGLDVSGIYMHTFFGGSSSSDFASPSDQEVYFANVKVEPLD